MYTVEVFQVEIGDPKFPRENRINLVPPSGKNWQGKEWQYNTDLTILLAVMEYPLPGWGKIFSHKEPFLSSLIISFLGFVMKNTDGSDTGSITKINLSFLWELFDNKSITLYFDTLITYNSRNYSNIKYWVFWYACQDLFILRPPLPFRSTWHYSRFELNNHLF